jgi:hypothetical protein
MLVRSAKWAWLKAWAMKIAKRRGLKKAIVADISAPASAKKEAGIGTSACHCLVAP